MKRKTNTTIALATALIGLLGVACSSKKDAVRSDIQVIHVASSAIQGNQMVMPQVIDIPDYHKIKLLDVGRLTYDMRPNLSPYLYIEVDNNLTEHISCEVIDSILTISCKKDIMPTDYRIYTNSTALSSVFVSGDASVDIEGLIYGTYLSITAFENSTVRANEIHVSDLMVRLSGTSTFAINKATSGHLFEARLGKASGLSVPNMSYYSINIDASGAASARMAGTSERTYITTNDAAQIETFELKSKYVECVAMKASKIEVTATDSIRPVTDGPSKIQYKGDPQVIPAKSYGWGLIESIGAPAKKKNEFTLEEILKQQASPSTKE